MLRYVSRMFVDEWRQWTPSIAVVAVMATMIGLCVHQFAWTSDPAFRNAVTTAGVPVAEFQILSVTIYSVIAVVAWVSLTVVGRASVHATRCSHALWLLMGAAPTTVFFATLLVLALVATCGAVIGAIMSTLLSFWAIPTFNAAVAPDANLPDFTVTALAPIATVAFSVATALIGGLLPARHASRTPPGAALRTASEEQRRVALTVLRVSGGSLFVLIAAGLIVAAGFATSLGSTSPASVFNLVVNAGGSALIATYLLCPELVALVFRILHGAFAHTRATAASLGVRAAADRVHLSTTTIAPLAAGLGGIGILLCAVNSVVVLTEALQPGNRTDLTDVWMMVAVVAVSMLATSAAVVALSARGRGREIALLQVAGMHNSQIRLLIASESLAMALAASTAATIPVITAGLASALASHAALGTAVVVWPIGAMGIGAVAAWLVLFLILLVPATGPLHDGPSTDLREQGI